MKIIVPLSHMFCMDAGNGSTIEFYVRVVKVEKGESIVEHRAKEKKKKDSKQE